ncbi:MAG: hypothetical protein MI923_25885 [Phycisphaerales bacterium]|nr:hypothetical protein [Phycisphaerales bacterium]
MQRKWMKYVGIERTASGGGSDGIDEERYGRLKVTYWVYRKRGVSEFGVTINRRVKLSNGNIKWVRTLTHEDIRTLYEEALPSIYARLRQFEAIMKN